MTSYEVAYELSDLNFSYATKSHPPDDVVRSVGGPHDLRGDEDDVEQVAQEEEAQCRELCSVRTPIQYTQFRLTYNDLTTRTSHLLKCTSKLPNMI